jgi:hypothetical protein
MAKIRDLEKEMKVLNGLLSTIVFLSFSAIRKEK